MTGNVYIVHAVDTEGPLYEGLDATFNQLKEQFGVELDPTRMNVEKLRSKSVELGGKEDAAAYFMRKDRIDTYNETWDHIDEMHDVFMSDEWRNRLLDSDGKPYVVSWYCMDHVGFNYNPRRRAMGYHEIYKYYKGKIKEFSRKKDKIYWHYHPMSFAADAHRMGYNYSYKGNLHNEILARRIIDHMWFPVSNRPGGHIETFDINCWLEQWMPFDLANQSMEMNDELDTEESAGRIPGRYGDWRGATTKWDVYNPSLYDYRKKGELNRWVGRCLNMNSRHSNISEIEIRNAFKKASAGENVLLSYTNHDFRNMINETEILVNMIQKVADEFTDIPFKWANAVEAFRATLGMKKIDLHDFDVEINERFIRLKLLTGDIWGVQPFLALKTHSGEYFHDNFIIDDGRTWTYAFDDDSINIDALSDIGFACNDKVGNTFVARINLSTRIVEKKYHNTDDWLTEISS
ncbi:hypothetical protein N9O98_01400 [Amylibacter sp.]|nr:hypothetical protein [Amylibacter sp.]